MKINEITELRGQKLVESLAVDNDTGPPPEELAKLVEASRKNKWESYSGDDFLKCLTEGRAPWQK